MRSTDLYNDAGKLKAAHDAFREAVKDLSDNYHWVRRAADDPYFYATKPADTALQEGLRPGSIVKVATNLFSGNVQLYYAVVVKPVISNAGNENVACEHVMLRFADGKTFKFTVYGLIGSPLSDESKMSTGDIKACDIPADLVRIVLGNCPLKNEGACMKGAGHE